MSKGKFLAVAIVWLFAAAAIAGAYRFLIHEPNRAHVVEDTSSASNYEHTLTVSIDSFSGYALLRSTDLRNRLAREKIQLQLIDDQADYTRRLDTLRSGTAPMAAFTIDALLTTCAESGDLPGSIVAVLDETRGADAVLAYRSAIPNIDGLNHPDVQFVLTDNSPSETLARVVMSHFQLDRLPPQPFINTRDASEVVAAFRSADPATRQAFVVWEPYVSRILENPQAHVVTDSSQFRGYIVDVLVVNRDFLLKNNALVRKFLECYFQTAYHYRDDMVGLVLADAKQARTPLTRQQAEKLVEGIWFKNTLDNFAHFGLEFSDHTQLLEDMIRSISHVLINTNALSTDPTGGQPTRLFYSQLLKQLQTSNFHPNLSTERIRDDKIRLPKLTDDQWQQLAPLGTLAVPKLVFARGTDRLNARSKTTLDGLVNTLQSFPRAYVLVQGNASQKGDLQANKELAMKRAIAAVRHLENAGVDKNRIRPVAGEPSGSTTVSFLLGQAPY